MTSLSVRLIDGWKNERGHVAPNVCVLDKTDTEVVETSSRLNSTLFNMYQAGKIGPVCGNQHASSGKKRVLSGGNEYPFSDANELDKLCDSLIAPLGNRILIAAGHFMPQKENFGYVNRNSFKSLQSGLNTLKRLHSMDIHADLLITINDVTINSLDEHQEDLPTLSRSQRQAYYENFQLPLVYQTEIEKVIDEVETDFKVIVIGENKLSEKLSKDAGKLRKQGLLVKSPDKNAYLLPFDVSNIVKLAHGEDDLENFYNLDFPVLISNQKGLTGRPKCVRACARLAAIPYELNYTGFIQFLPICSRNAIEGFLLGEEIYKRKYGRAMPYISVHHVLSCF